MRAGGRDPRETERLGVVDSSLTSNHSEKGRRCCEIKSTCLPWICTLLNLELKCKHLNVAFHLARPKKAMTARNCRIPVTSS